MEREEIRKQLFETRVQIELAKKAKSQEELKKLEQTAKELHNAYGKKIFQEAIEKRKKR